MYQTLDLPTLSHNTPPEPKDHPMTDLQQPPTHAPDWNEPAQTPPAPRRKRSAYIAPIVVVALIVVAVVAMISGFGGDRSGTPVTTTVPTSSIEAPAYVPPAPVGHTVDYLITGGSALSVSYSTPGFGISQAANVTLPWSKTLTFDSGSVVAVVNAQNAGGGTIACSILIDGVQVANNTSTGQYAIVQCTGSNR